MQARITKIVDDAGTDVTRWARGTQSKRTVVTVEDGPSGPANHVIHWFEAGDIKCHCGVVTLKRGKEPVPEITAEPRGFDSDLNLLFDVTLDNDAPLNNKAIRIRFFPGTADELDVWNACCPTSGEAGTPGHKFTVFFEVIE